MGLLLADQLNSNKLMAPVLSLCYVVDLSDSPAVSPGAKGRAARRHQFNAHLVADGNQR